VKVAANPEPHLIQAASTSSSSNYWCDDLTYVKLEVGNNAKIVWDKVNLRSAPKVPDDFYANIVTELKEGARLTIIDGPECAHNGTWWKVRAETGKTGWVREHISGGYLMMP
jgi:SH3-like domain-containing protein